jgi:hypothetical protein
VLLAWTTRGQRANERGDRPGEPSGDCERTPCRPGDLCASWDTDSVETALLLTSELVTNAVRHGRSDVRLQVAVDGDLLRVDVGDDNSRHPLRKPSDLGALDGRGLQIVELLALRWGVDDEPLGKRVWFELSR